MTVTPTDLRKMVPDIMDTAKVPDDQIQWAIDDATTIMQPAWIAANPPISTAKQELVKKYLAAHFLLLNIERGGLLHSRFSDADESYTSSRNNIGVSLSRYGQQAIAFDDTGFLASTVSRQAGTAQFRVV